MNVCESILFFAASGLDDNGVIIGDGNKPPPFDILTDSMPVKCLIVAKQFNTPI